uniref:YL1_C domain-containing protein n=1 Tax=Strongyloides stercoralis TaxID=6248 RepID=A0A0K0DSG8_STRER
MKRPSNEPVEKTPARRSKRVKASQSNHVDSDIDEETSYTNSPASKEASEPVEEKAIPVKKTRKSRSVRDNSQDSGSSGKNTQTNDNSTNEVTSRRRSSRNIKETTSKTTAKEEEEEEVKPETASGEKEEVEEEDDESTDTESSDEESIDFSKIETVAKGRPRRANAGNRMELLLTKEEKELMAEAPPEYQDYFNKKEDNSIPDGENDLFSEKDIDDSGDEIDTDFLDSDKSDDEMNGDEAEKNVLAMEREEKRRLKRKYKSTALDIPISAYNVQPNVLSPEEHEKALEKSLKIAEQNIASLQKYQAMEIEIKNKRFNKNKKKMRPMDVDIIIKKGDERLLHLAVEPVHNVPKKGERLICAISGKPAKYFDPLTEIPYYSIEEFKIIRKMYEEYLTTVEIDLKNLRVSKNADVQ